MIMVSSFTYSISESVISRENGLIWRLYVTIFLVKTLLKEGEEGVFIRRGRLKQGGVDKLFLIIGGAFFGGRLLKEGGHLLEDLPYCRTSVKGCLED